MAGYSTSYYDAKIVDHGNNVALWTPPSTLYLALTTVVLTRFDVVMPSGAEMVGAAYARVAIPNNNTFWSAAVLVTPDPLDNATWYTAATNLVVVRFAAATATYPALPGWAFLDDPLAGNVLYAGVFTNAGGSPVAGQNPTIAVGEIEIAASGV